MGDLILDAKTLPASVQELQNALNQRVIGQERAIHHIIKAYTPMTVNIHREGRPLGVFLFMGPTGVGKTETVRTFAKQLLGSRDSLTRIDCVEFDKSHETAKLLGAPPGYIGYDKEPRLSQKNIDQFQTDTNKVNIVLFDEIEKADESLFDAIMTILGDGRLTLGNGKTVDFTRTFVFLTSNLGSEEVRKALEGTGIGFVTKGEALDVLDDRVYRISKEIIKRKFRPEFINRIDSLVVFRALSTESLGKILKIELNELHWSIWRSPWRDLDTTNLKPNQIPPKLGIVFRLTPAARGFILKEGTSDVYGARELSRTVDRYLRFPLATLIASKQLGNGDACEIDYTDGASDLTFRKVEKESGDDLG